MASFAPLAFAAPIAVLVALTAACSGDDVPVGGAVDPLAAGGSACTAKACGQDCTPAGSDEPFHCTAQGTCVAAGEPLGCAPSGTDGGSGATDAVCTGKVCGQDCTAQGSDEPFNCTVEGRCVATGTPLGCAGTAPEAACAGRPCAADCTPPGSDEPFNCSAAGRCVAAGAELGCRP